MKELYIYKQSLLRDILEDILEMPTYYLQCGRDGVLFRDLLDVICRDSNFELGEPVTSSSTSTTATTSSAPPPSPIIPTYCKDCIFCTAENTCERTDLMVKPDDYCSYAFSASNDKEAENNDGFVSCKDCVYCDHDITAIGPVCDISNEIVNDSWFCSSGRRKEVMEDER